MKLFNRVAIVGVGLIGGSIGLAIKKRRLAREVIGISRHRKTINLAIKRGAIDWGSLDIQAVSRADLVILAAPVNSIIKIGIKINSIVHPKTLITDVGSVKESIVKILQKALPNFVGTHPLMGTEKQGVINAQEDLFQGSLCVLTPTKKTPKEALRIIRRLWIELGARIVYLSPARHDKLISYVSHLPHMIAFSLLQSVPHNSLYLASRGLKDTTRIAASPETLWKDILLSNSKNILAAIDKFLSSLSKTKTAIIKKDEKELEKILRQARLKRQALQS